MVQGPAVSVDEEINDEKERLFSASSWKVYEERSLAKGSRSCLDRSLLLVRVVIVSQL